jgi:hypothetical protein
VARDASERNSERMSSAHVVIGRELGKMVPSASPPLRR